MMNQVVLLGRVKGITQAPEYGTEVSVITIVTPRSYKNEDGVYEEDIFDLIVRSKSMQENCSSYLKEKDLIGIRGRLEMYKYTKEENGETKKMRRTIIVPDKITFLSSSTNSSESVDADEE